MAHFTMGNTEFVESIRKMLGLPDDCLSFDIHFAIEDVVYATCTYVPSFTEAQQANLLNCLHIKGIDLQSVQISIQLKGPVWFDRPLTEEEVANKNNWTIDPSKLPPDWTEQVQETLKEGGRPPAFLVDPKMGTITQVKDPAENILCPRCKGERAQGLRCMLCGDRGYVSPAILEELAQRDAQAKTVPAASKKSWVEQMLHPSDECPCPVCEVERANNEPFDCPHCGNTGETTWTALYKAYPKMSKEEAAKLERWAKEQARWRADKLRDYYTAVADAPTAVVSKSTPISQYEKRANLGGHYYPCMFDTMPMGSTRINCAHGCGCWIGSTQNGCNGSDLYLDPMGECPNNPRKE